MFFSFRQLTHILTSTALSNSFLVALSLLLARTQPAEAYADFAYAVSVFAICSLLLDFGLNVSALKRQENSNNQDTPITFASVKLFFAFLLSLFIISYVYYSGEALLESTIAVGLLCASFNNVWLAMRVDEQGRGDSKGFFKANLSLFGLRLICLTVTYLSNPSPVLYLLALYVYPYILLFPLQRQLFLFNTHLPIFWSNAKQIFSYSKWIFISALLFVLSAQIPLLSLGKPELSVDLATLGVAMTIASLSSWLSYSLKPFFIGRYLSSGTIEGAFNKVFIQFLVIMIPLTVAVYFIYRSAFGEQYPNVEIIGTVIFIYTSLVFILGLYNSQIHVSGRPELEALVNMVRASAVLFVMQYAEMSLLHLIMLVGLIMITMEVVLMKINFQLIKSKNENNTY